MHTYTYIYMFQYSSERLTQIARREMINRAKFYIYMEDNDTEKNL